MHMNTAKRVGGGLNLLGGRYLQIIFTPKVQLNDKLGKKTQYCFIVCCFKSDESLLVKIFSFSEVCHFIFCRTNISCCQIVLHKLFW